MKTRRNRSDIDTTYDYSYWLSILIAYCIPILYILGLALYKLFEYLTKRNRRKIMARHGLKQIGEHMHVVTRTMSAFTEQEASGMIENMTYFITKFI